MSPSLGRRGAQSGEKGGREEGRKIVRGSRKKQESVGKTERVRKETKNMKENGEQKSRQNK